MTMLERDNRIAREAVAVAVGFAVGLAAYELANNEELKGKVAKTAKGIFNSGAKRFNSFLNSKKEFGLIKPPFQETVLDSEPLKAANNGIGQQERQERLSHYRARLNSGAQNRPEPLIETAPPEESVIDREAETREPVVISTPRRTFGVPKRLLGVAGVIAFLAAAGMVFLQIEDKANIQKMGTNTPPPETIRGDNTQTTAEIIAVLPSKVETDVNYVVPMINITSAQSLSAEQARAEFGSSSRSFPDPDPIMGEKLGSNRNSSLTGIAQAEVGRVRYGLNGKNYSEFWQKYNGDPDSQSLTEAYMEVAKDMNPGKFFGIRKKGGNVDYAIPHFEDKEKTKPNVIQLPINVAKLFANALSRR